jgi:hypothetical protein
MVIRTEYRGTRYSMGSSDPLPVGFEIRFGGLNFQATGNSYLMRLTNREELRARRQAGSAPVAAARVATTPTLASTDAAGPSASRRRRRSGQRSRQARSERRQAERVASQRGAPVSTTTAGERMVSGPRFPIGLRGATAAYTANASANATMRRVPPGRHVYVARERLRRRRVVPRLSRHIATCQPARVHGVGLFRRVGPSHVQAFPRRHGLLVRLLRRLQHRKLRPRAGMLRRHRQRPSECHRRDGRRRRRCSARSRDRFAPSSGTKRPLLRHPQWG